MNGKALICMLLILLLTPFGSVGGAASAADDGSWTRLSQPALKQRIQEQTERCKQSTNSDAHLKCLNQLFAMEAEFGRRKRQLQTMGFVPPEDSPGLGSRRGAGVTTQQSSTADPSVNVVTREEEERLKVDDPFYTGGELDF